MNWFRYLNGNRAAIFGAIPIVAALLLSGLISYSYNVLLKEYRDAVDHTFSVQSGLDKVLLRLQDAETGQRGFIITGDANYLAPKLAAESSLTEAFAELTRLLSDNAGQQTSLTRLRADADAKLAELDETIASRQSQGFAAAQAIVARNSGKETMDRIRELQAAMQVTERKLLDERLAQARRAERMMILVGVICVALSIIGRALAALVAARMKRGAT